jgi:hypothetical protein
MGRYIERLLRTARSENGDQPSESRSTALIAGRSLRDAISAKQYNPARHIPDIHFAYGGTLMIRLRSPSSTTRLESSHLLSAIKNRNWLKRDFDKWSPKRRQTASSQPLFCSLSKPINAHEIKDGGLGFRGASTIRGPGGPRTV